MFNLQVTNVILTVYCQNGKNNEILCNMSCYFVYLVNKIKHMVCKYHMCRGVQPPQIQCATSI